MNVISFYAKRPVIVDLSKQFEEFKFNRLKWSVLGKQFYTMKVPGRNEVREYRMRVFNKVGGNNVINMFKPA